MIQTHQYTDHLDFFKQLCEQRKQLWTIILGEVPIYTVTQKVVLNFNNIYHYASPDYTEVIPFDYSEHTMEVAWVSADEFIWNKEKSEWSFQAPVDWGSVWYVIKKNG